MTRYYSNIVLSLDITYLDQSYHILSLSVATGVHELKSSQNTFRYLQQSIPRSPCFDDESLKEVKLDFEEEACSLLGVATTFDVRVIPPD